VILLTCAIEKELSFWQPRHDVEVLATGVGPVEAACFVTRALAQQRYRLLVNAGLAGAVDGAAELGEGVAVSDEILELALEDGRPIVLPEGHSVVDKVHSDVRLIAAVAKRGYRVVRGITVARVTSSEETADRLARLGIGAESMEGFAALRAAQLAGVPAIELRGISNRVGSRERSGWSFERGQRGLQRVLDAFFKEVDVAEADAAS
jgi:futalosine hydrolase